MPAEARMESDPPPESGAAAYDLAEERWVRALRAGDGGAFEALYGRHRGRVYGLAFRLTGARAEAEELTQEVFVRAWEHRSGFESGTHLARWLRRVAVNLWINGLRRREPEGEEPGADRLAGGGAPPSGLRLDLERAIAALPPRLRAVLLLFDLYGLRHEEIAEQLEITAGASKVQLHRARRRLQEMLQ